MADPPPRPLGAPGGLMLSAAASAALAAPVLAGVYAAEPAAARVLAGLARPIAAPLPGPAPGAGRNTPALPPRSPPPTQARITLVAAPAVLTEAAVYAPEADRPIRLARRIAAPAFQPALSEPPAG